MFREVVIRIPPKHPIYPWAVHRDRLRNVPGFAKADLCAVHVETMAGCPIHRHDQEHVRAHRGPLTLNESLAPVGCRICPGRPAFQPRARPLPPSPGRWRGHVKKHGEADFEEWLFTQEPFPRLWHVRDTRLRRAGGFSAGALSSASGPLPGGGHAGWCRASGQVVQHP